MGRLQKFRGASSTACEVRIRVVLYGNSQIRGVESSASAAVYSRCCGFRCHAAVDSARCVPHGRHYPRRRWLGVKIRYRTPHRWFDWQQFYHLLIQLLLSILSMALWLFVGL